MHASSPGWIFRLGALALLLTGCSTAPKYSNHIQPDDALVRFETGTRGEIALGGLAVSPTKLDGQSIAWNKEEALHVRPGKHEFELFAGGIHIFQKQATEFVDVEIEANHRYLFKVAAVDGNFVISVIDDTDPAAPKTIKTFKAKASRPRILPLPIPIK